MGKYTTGSGALIIIGIVGRNSRNHGMARDREMN